MYTRRSLASLKGVVTVLAEAGGLGVTDDDVGVRNGEATVVMD